jgi:hypothetical protein
MERLCTLDRKKKLEDMMRWAEDKRKSALLVALKKGKFSEDQVKVLDEFSYAFMWDILIPLFGGFMGGINSGDCNDFKVEKEPRFERSLMRV